MVNIIEIDLNKDTENQEWEVRVYHDGIHTAEVRGPKISIPPDGNRTYTTLRFKK
jgi:hypothetical protein